MMTKISSGYSVGVASTALMLFLLLPSLLMHCATVAGTVHVVGDSGGWINPHNASFYNSWTSNKTFHLNDVLEFNFMANRHDVVKAPKASYDSCSKDNITIISKAPTNVTLNETGTHYFICSISDHCEEGMKLAVNVLNSSAASPNATSSPPPAAASPRLLAGSFLTTLSFALANLFL